MISLYFCRAGIMWMTIGDKRFAITLDDNESARALAQLLPLTWT